MQIIITINMNFQCQTKNLFLFMDNGELYIILKIRNIESFHTKNGAWVVFVYFFSEGYIYKILL